MTLYEIDARIADVIERHTDPETGELLLDPAALDALVAERETKLESIAIYIKTLVAEEAALNAEIATLRQRMQKKVEKAARLTRYLEEALAGQNFETPRCACTFRRKPLSVSIDSSQAFMAWAAGHDGFLRQPEPEPDKKAIAAALKSGAEIPGVSLRGGLSFTVK